MEDRHAEETQTLRELLAIMQEHDLEHLKIKLGDSFYELSRRDPAATSREGADPPPAGPTAEEAAPAPVAGANVTKVIAPLTGVFYRASSPDAAAYVDVGDRVEVGDVLCVLEAMKLFNEIQSDYAGTIARVVPGNGELVSQGEELFWIEP
ncbi:MAG: biotin/lipoyl-containing protein [Candidatus Baltobacteraceae bacterium]